MNKKYRLIDGFLPDLTFLAFDLEGLQIRRLARFKVKMGDRWFDDIIDNSEKEAT